MYISFFLFHLIIEENDVLSSGKKENLNIFRPNSLITPFTIKSCLQLIPNQLEYLSRILWFVINSLGASNLLFRPISPTPNSFLSFNNMPIIFINRVHLSLPMSRFGVGFWKAKLKGVDIKGGRPSVFFLKNTVNNYTGVIGKIIYKQSLSVLVEL